MAGAQLIGVVPVAEELSSSAFCEAGLPAGSLAGKVFQRIVTRLAGDYVELLIQ